MKFIKFTTSQGQPVWINPANGMMVEVVEDITSSTDGKRVRVHSNGFVTLDESDAGKVLKALSGIDDK